MEMATQTDFPFFGVEENTEYFPGFSEIEEIFLENGKIINIVRCPFSKDFSTQTEYNTQFDRCVDKEIDVY
jgi:hypothetical protein